MGSQISIETSNDAAAVSSAIFNGPGVSITDATFEKSYCEQNELGGYLGSADTYNQNVDTQIDGSEYCGPDTTNAAVLSVELIVEPEYNRLSIEFILATRENFVNPDPIDIYLDGVQYAVDTSQNRITAKS
ncbi:hypothetical protein ACKAV7_011300 [Fusarium commune]